VRQQPINYNIEIAKPYQWEDETVRERTGHPPSYAEAKKITWIKLHHTHG